MICTCDKCFYTFYSDSLPLTCPDCGSQSVREATLEEKDWFHDLEMEKKHNPLLLDKTDFKAS
jgi:Zn finger protein HypA/HybF involved in hydrogenase expression